ncbi:MAG: hypothetical protein RMK00_08740 [Bacteroidota bacterium]|nr:porin family protein [Candidatus Kapabacteria bacterium]MCX7937609.1 porin family protein [Chlorobiota bacterium]MDW8075840.1 hypothetical protein [Bacteroidota bacterium]
MKRFLFAAVATFLAVQSGAFAQNPTGQFGVGLAFGDGLGTQLTYAINPNIHIGGRLSFGTTSASGSSQSTFVFGPFFRYLFATRGVAPYLNAEFEYASFPVTNPLTGSSENVTRTSLVFSGGIAYYINPSFGIRGEIHLLALGLDPSSTTFSISPARICVDWFFDR